MNNRYKTKALKTVMSFILFFIYSEISYAISPIESLILGDYSQKYHETKHDPLNYIFSYNNKEKTSKMYKKRLSIYRGFIEEGSNLKNYCSANKNIVSEMSYESSWQYDQLKRSISATLQYVGLDLAVRSIPKYAKYFEFTDDEYSNLVNHITGNFCSKNITVIGIKELKKNLLLKFNKQNSFELPYIKGDPLFAKELQNVNTIDKSREYEFLQTIDLFKSLCSWGGGTDLRMMDIYLKNPVIFSFIIRQLTGVKIDWEPNKNKLVYSENKSSINVLCNNLICRKTDHSKFYKNIPRVIGSDNLESDLKRLYCSKFNNLSIKKSHNIPEVNTWMKSFSAVDRKLLIGQFIALITSIPDFFVRAEKFSDGKKFLKSSFLESWKTWAKERGSYLNKELYYEETLTIEKVERKFYFNKYIPKFKVVFDVNLGEFDRVNQVVGKLNVNFNSKVSKKYLAWARTQWLDVADGHREKRKGIVENMAKHVAIDVNKANKKFIIPLWKGKLERLVAIEILEQLAKYRGDYFKRDNNGFSTISIDLNFGTFALKYINRQFIIKQNLKKKKIKKLK